MAIGATSMVMATVQANVRRDGCGIDPEDHPRLAHCLNPAELPGSCAVAVSPELDADRDSGTADLLPTEPSDGRLNRSPML